jgi:hypothetical protein
MSVRSRLRLRGITTRGTEVDLHDLADRMGRRADAVPLRHARILRAVSDEVLETVVRNTPVDEGVARSNWLVSVDAEVDAVIEPYDRLEKGTDLSKFFETSNADGAIAAGREVLSLVTQPATVFVQNSVAYIGLLNYGGYSLQSSRFVRTALVAGRAVLTYADMDLFNV